MICTGPLWNSWPPEVFPVQLQAEEILVKWRLLLPHSVVTAGLHVEPLRWFCLLQSAINTCKDINLHFCDYTNNQICNITYTGTCSSIYFINSVIGKLLGHKLGLHNYTKQIWHKNVNTLIFNHNIVENYVSLLGLIEFDHTQTRIITSL